MTRRNLLFVLLALVLGLMGSTQIPLHAQKPSRAVVVKTAAQDAPHEVKPRLKALVNTAAPSAKVSLQDALHRPYDFAFSKSATLGDVAARLTADLGGPVVLDLAALERLDVRPDDSVRLELKGVRLKTGLKLLLDQKRLTYRLIPEDNLLIITDKEGADDPLDKVWTELSHLHNDVHDIQDLVEELYDLTSARAELDSDDAPRLRQPTIVEETPGAPSDGPAPGAGPKPEPEPEPEAPPHSTSPKRSRTHL